MLIIAEVGDIHRFATARRLCSWARLTPTVRSSDAKVRLGHISSQGSRALRWALVEAAQHAGTGGGTLRETYERIAKRRGKQIAKSPSPARSSPSATTACATERSVAWRPGPRRARSDHRRSAHDPPRRSCAARPGAQRLLERTRLLSMASARLPAGEPTAARLIERSSVARHNRPA
jgi:hypothetical protein